MARKPETHICRPPLGQVVPQRQPADEGQLRVAPGLRDLFDEAYHVRGDTLEVVESESGGSRGRSSSSSHVLLPAPVQLWFSCSV